MQLARRMELGWSAPIVLSVWCFGAWAADSSLVNSTAPDRQQKLEATARAEGSISLYTSIAQKDLAPLISPFEKCYGIKVNVWRASGDIAWNKLLAQPATITSIGHRDWAHVGQS